MAIVIELYPEAFIALNQELIHHSELQRLLANHPQDQFEVLLAEIATYCDVVLDGVYTSESLQKLAEILRGRLIKKRQGVLLLNSPISTLMQ